VRAGRAHQARADRNARTQRAHARGARRRRANPTHRRHRSRGADGAVAASADAPAFDGGTRDRRAGRPVPRCRLLSLHLFALAGRRGRPRRRAASHRIRPRPPGAPRAGPLTPTGIDARGPHRGRRGDRAGCDRRRALTGSPRRELGAATSACEPGFRQTLPPFNVPVCRIAIVQARWHTPYFGPEARSHSKSMRHTVRKVLVGILILFLLPLAVHAALYAGKDRPRSFRDADWSSVGMLPPADADRDARFLVFTGRTGRWKGIFAVHSWVVFKPENATSWSRYDVVGWAQPIRTSRCAPRVGRRTAAGSAIPRACPSTYADPRRRRSFQRSRRRSRPMATAIPATIASGPDRTATPSPPPYCAPCRSSRPRCRRMRW